MTLRQLLEEGREELEKAGVADWALDARYLLMAAFDLDLASLLVKQERQILPGDESEEKTRCYRQMIGRRAGRAPLQQILGEQEFMGLPFRVNEHVLTPRQDTETLVELVLRERPDPSQSVLDLCTGSGCIALSRARLGGYRRVWASDLSEEALKVAEENAKGLLKDPAESKAEFRLLKSDLFEGIPKEERFDILTSNPPYIPTEVIEGLEPEVRDHEPRMALDGDEDGLKFYRILAAEAGGFLNPGGVIYLEIGWDQGAKVEELLRQAGFQEIRTVKDLAGKDRVVRAGWP